MTSEVRRLATPSLKDARQRGRMGCAREVAEKTAGQFANLPYKQKNTEWKAHLRMLDNSDPSYRM